MLFRIRFAATLSGLQQAHETRGRGAAIVSSLAALALLCCGSAVAAPAGRETAPAPSPGGRSAPDVTDTSEAGRPARPETIEDDESATPHPPKRPYTPAPLKRVEVGLVGSRGALTSYRPIAGKEYVLGGYDEIDVSVLGPKPERWPLVVSPQGVIDVPLVGTVSCSGMTIAALEKTLTARFNRYLRNFTLTVIVTRVRGIQVTVTGQVVTPGSYSLPGMTGLWGAIQEGGGITEAGSVRTVRVTSLGGKERVVDLYPFLFRGQAKADLTLDSGDTVYVPVAERIIGLAGEVRRPGLYEFKTGETLFQLLEMGGGPSAEAALDKAYVERVTSDRQKMILPVDVSPATGRTQPLELHDGDALVLPPVSLYLGRVEVSGEVRRPGSFERKQNMRLQDLLNLAGGLTGSAVTDRAFIRRVKENKSLEVLWVDVAKALAGDTAANIAVHEGDHLSVPSVQTFVGAVSIQGEVAQPLQRYHLAAGMTIRDLVKIAGGLTVSAAPERAHLIRVSRDDQTSRLHFVDIVRALGGDPVHDLVLQDGDAITVPATGAYSGTVSAGGEVRKPSSHQLTTHMTVRDLIALAGGVTVRAAPTKAFIERVTERGGLKRIVWLDVARAQAGDPEHNLPLQDGDALLVPGSGSFYGKVSVTGELRGLSVAQVAEGKQEGLGQGGGADVRAAAAGVGHFDLTEQMRLSDLVRLAGGPTAMAALARSRLVRVGPGGLREAAYVDLEKVMARVGGDEDLALQDGDSLHVPSISLFQQTVRVAGELVGAGIFETAAGVVKRRGLYELKEGDTVRDLVQAAGGWTANAALRAARIDRQRPDGTTERLPVDLHRLLVQQDEAANVALRNGDEFTVPAIADMVYVVGAVNQPGAYEYREGNNRVMDMLARAGGASPRATLSAVRLVRGELSEKQDPIRLDMDAVIKRGKVHLDPGVRPGDVVFVPEKAVVVQDVMQLLGSISLLRFYLGQ